MAISHPNQNDAELDQTAVVTATMTVLVTRNAEGDLAAGVETRLAALESVEAVERVEIRGLRPALNDLRVHVEAILVVTGPPDDAGAVAARLREGFGVRAVERVTYR
jgi:hypothetical protein